MEEHSWVMTLVPTLITLVRLRPHDKFVTFPEFKKIKNFAKKFGN